MEYLGDTVESLVIALRVGLVVTQEPVSVRVRAGGHASQSTLRAAAYLARPAVSLSLVVALFPVVLHTPADLIAVAVPASLLFFGASMLLLVSVQHSNELGRLEERSRTLAEEVALLRLDLESRPAAGSDS